MEISATLYMTKDIKPIRDFPVNSSQFDDNAFNHEKLPATYHHLSQFLPYIMEPYALIAFGAAMVGCWNDEKFLEGDTV